MNFSLLLHILEHELIRIRVLYSRLEILSNVDILKNMVILP